MRTAYLVGELDIEQSPPVVVSVGIFSVSASSLTTNLYSRRSFDIVSVDATSFHDAMAKIELILDNHPYFNWVKPLLEYGVNGERNTDG